MQVALMVVAGWVMLHITITFVMGGYGAIIEDRTTPLRKAWEVVYYSTGMAVLPAILLLIGLIAEKLRKRWPASSAS